MNYNEKVFNEQIHIMRDFLYHYASYSYLNQNFECLVKKGAYDFWVYAMNSHYFQAVNLWCMVFGTDSNETHWKKLELDVDLKRLILNELNMTEKEYIAYWKTIIDWRNKYSAHRELKYEGYIPDLKNARRIVYIYEKWVKKNIDSSFSFSLKTFEENFVRDVEKMFTELMMAQ